MEDAEHDEEHARHEGGYRESLKSILLDDAIYNNNERARGASDLHLRASEERDDESGHDGGDDTLLGCDA